MVNPINYVVVPYRGKTYNCTLSIGALALIEGEVNTSIVYPGPDNIWKKPEAFQRAVFLYALLKSAGQEATLEECAGLIVGEKRVRYAEQLGKAIEQLMPKLKALWGVEEAEGPLAEESEEKSTGPASGPSEESPSDLANLSSGA